MLFLQISTTINSCGEAQIQSHNSNKKTMQTEIVLPGKIAVYRDTCFIYNNSERSSIKFKINRFSKNFIGGYAWMNTKDDFIATEYFKGQNRDIKGDLVTTNIKGEKLELIFSAKNGEVAGNCFFNGNDSMLLFTITKQGDFSKNHLEGLMRKQSLVIMDFAKRQIVKVIGDIGISPSFALNESPWLVNSSGIIYTINYDNGVANINENNDAKEEGIYLYDLKADITKLLIPRGSKGVCSPTEMKVAYSIGSSIYIFDLINKSMSLVRQGSEKQKIKDLHWTPDGNYIYFVYYDFLLGDIDFETHEKLIDAKTFKEISFKGIKHGYHSYSWKK